EEVDVDEVLGLDALYDRGELVGEEVAKTVDAQPAVSDTGVFDRVEVVVDELHAQALADDGHGELVAVARVSRHQRTVCYVGKETDDELGIEARPGEEVEIEAAAMVQVVGGQRRAAGEVEIVSEAAVAQAVEEQLLSWRE